MAGWSKVTDGSALDCLRTLEAIQKNGFSLKFGEIDHNFRALFNLTISRFSKEIRRSSCFRPLPPMLGDGKPIDLLKLYLCMRAKGGHQSVSENGCWDLIANETGFDSNDSVSLKLVYVKYLELFDEWFRKIAKDKDSSKGGSFFIDSMEKFSDFEMKDYMEFVGMREDDSGLDVKDVQSCVGSIGCKDFCDEVSVFGSDLGTDEESESNQKRKRECYLPLLDWVKRVSKNPCDPAIGTLPERSKWKAYGSEHVWKQVLLAREAMLLKVNVDSKVEQTVWKKKMKMHPTMYEDRTEKLTSRCSQRLISAKETQPIVPSRKPAPQDCSGSSSTGSPCDREDEESFWGYNFKRKRTPLGRYFQAKLPEWAGQAYETDRRYLGTQIWPLEKTETRSGLIELERVGKGRQDSCGCQFPSSLECVGFHVNEKRNRVKLELGSAFAKWKFDEMGENIGIKWAWHEQKKFEEIIKSSPTSSGPGFWAELLAHFKNKPVRDLVSYYFNVYLVRRRAHQNRFDPSHIDSDDDELEKVGNEANSKPTGSILCSPKKAHLNVK